MVRHISYSLPLTRRQFDRSKLPKPENYYAQQFPELKNKSVKSAWVNVHCCFHDDSQPSLGINLISGGFHCFACGAKGGDVLAFQRMRYRLSFVRAVDLWEAWYDY